jgi:hypothetical protein
MLPENERKVIVKQYLSEPKLGLLGKVKRIFKPETHAVGVDEYIYNRAMEKQSLNEKFTNVLQGKRLEKTGAISYTQALDNTSDDFININSQKIISDRNRAKAFEINSKISKGKEIKTNDKNLRINYFNNRYFIQDSSHNIKDKIGRRSPIAATIKNVNDLHFINQRNIHQGQTFDVNKIKLLIDNHNQKQKRNRLLISAGIAGTLGIGAYLNHKRKTNVN